MAKARERTRKDEDTAARERPRSKRTSAGVMCNDGTHSTATGRGACSRHGGVAGTVTIEREQDSAKPSRRTEPLPMPADGALCSDGTRSTTTGRGACSHHGGVAGAKASESSDNWGESARRTKRTRPRHGGEPVARCADGTVSYSLHDRGTCSYHGGVARWY